MKKKLLALAVAGAFVAPVAMAESNVTIYGVADVSYDNTRNGDSGAISGVTNNKISSNASHIGFKGAEDLGSGLKAIWQIESLVNMDHSPASGSGSTFGTRNTFAGLSGDSWGSFTLGRNNTPYKTATRAMDMFHRHIADNRSLMGGVSGKSSYTAFDSRFTDTARYDSPNMSGFKVAAAYTASAESNSLSTADVKGRAESLSATYETGPFTGALAYQKHTFGSDAAGALGSTLSTTLTDEKAWKVGGGYKMDQFGVNAVYEKTSDSLGSAGRGHKAYYVSGLFNATANDAIKAGYTKARNLGDGSMANSGAKQWSLGVDHSLSKRTMVYAMYTKLDNDSGASYGLSYTPATGNTAAVGAGADPSAFSLGLKHIF